MEYLMGTFRKSLKRGNKSRQIEENLKKLDRELKKTGALEATPKSEKLEHSSELKKFDWRREFFPEKDQFEMINLLYEDRQQKLKNAIGEEKIRIAEEVESLREAVENKRQLRQLQRVDEHLSNIDVEFYKLRDELVENINEEMFPNIPKIEEKLDEILTVYGKLNKKISEGLLNEPSDSPQGGDPLANKNFVTFEQLKKHYTLFLDRISAQLATLGGGGETQLKYLDDVVGIQTNPSVYDGKYLKYNHTLGTFEFSDVGPIGIATEIQTLDNVLGLGNTSSLGIDVGISTFNNVVVGGATTALLVNGDVRVVGVLTVGSGTITIDGDNNSIGIGTVNLTESQVSQLSDLTGDGGTFGGDVNITGVLTAANIETTNVSVAGSVTATTFYGDGSQLTGLSVGVGTTSISTTNIDVSGTTSTQQLSVSGISTFQGNVYFGDNDRLYFGDNNELAIFYNSASGNSVISGLNTSNLNINAATHFFKNQTGSETKAAFYSNGSVELYYDNVRRFSTTGTGATVYGDVSVASSLTAQSFYGDGSNLTGIIFTGGNTVFTGIVTFQSNALFDDNDKAIFGNDIDLQIYHDGADSYVSETGTGNLILNSNGTNVEIKFNNTEYGARFMDGGGSYIYHNNLLKIETLGTGATTYGTHYATSFSGIGSELTGITTSQIVDFGNVNFGIGSSTNVNTTGTITAGAFFGDGSSLTGIATPGYVNAAVASLVDSAPETLDTLNELSQALGNNPNFSTTITNLIATKASLAGAAFTGNVSVSNGNLSIGSTLGVSSRIYGKERLYLGADEAFHFYSYDTGNPATRRDYGIDAGVTKSDVVFSLRHGSAGVNTGGYLQITDGSNLQSAVFRSGDGGVELYHCVDGESPTLRFETNAQGANVVGILTANRFVGAATSNIMPFLYATYADLPDAGTYHGAFAHVHATGGAYYAHSGNWVRLVNYSSDETSVGLGTVNLTTTGNIGAGIVTANSGEYSNVRIASFGSNNIYGLFGALYLDSTWGVVDVVNNLNVNGIGTFVGDLNLKKDVVGLSSAIFAGIVTAQAFVGDGSGLTGIVASLSLNDLTDVNAGSPSIGQVLKWSGSEWTAAADLTAAGGSGIGLTDLSVTVNSPGISTLSYSNVTGVFSYTPPDLSSYLTSTITQNVTMSNGYVYTFDSSATARFGTIGSNNYGDLFWGTSGSATGLHVENKDTDGGLYLTNTGTSGVYIRPTATELGASFIPNAEANLYYNNSLKLSTIGVGASVYGDLHVNGTVNITGVVTAQEFKGVFTGVANYASVAGVASTSTYATESVTSGYASVSGIASGLTGTPSITVNQINTTGGLFVGAGQTSSFGDRVTIRDDLGVEGSTPTIRIQDSDNAENYAYMQYDSSAGPALKFRTRCFDNTPHFIWQSEASGGIDNTQYLMYMQGGAPGAYNHGYVSFGSTTADERLHVGGSLKVTENINATGILTANIIRATTGVDAPLYITESVDDDNYYNMVMLNGIGQGGNTYRVTMVDNGGIQFNPFRNELLVNNVNANQFGFFGNGTNITGIPTAIIAGNGISIGSSTGIVEISATATGISTTETLVTAGINALGVVTATQFIGDGSGLTGIVAAGSGVVIQEEGGSVGTAGTINFVGAAVTASLVGGIATVEFSNYYSEVSGIATYATVAGVSTYASVAGISTSSDYAILAGVSTYASVSGIATSAEGLTGSPNLNVGVVTATQFIGDGSGLTGIVASGTGITIQEEGSLVGTASTINFVGAAVTATIASGTATISISAPAPVAGSKFIDNVSGIHTTSAVGIKTDLPKTDLQVGTFGMQSGIGTFISAAGSPQVIDQFNVATFDFKTAEYTIHIQHANGMQTQKVLLMQDGSSSYSSEYGIMFTNEQLVSIGSTISAGVCQLQVTPVSGINGITTYRFSRGTLL
jgi:hypothetical protein